jgi:hypothetical protein
MGVAKENASIEKYQKLIPFAYWSAIAQDWRTPVESSKLKPVKVHTQPVTRNTVGPSIKNSSMARSSRSPAKSSAYPTARGLSPISLPHGAGTVSGFVSRGLILRSIRFANRAGSVPDFLQNPPLLGSPSPAGGSKGRGG